MTTHNDVVETGIGNITKCLSLFLTLFLLTACGGNARLNLAMSLTNENLDRQVKVSAPELRKILTDHFGFVHVKLTDPDYALPADDKIAQLNDPAHCFPFADDSMPLADWDCDDYTFSAMLPMRNYAFGAVYVKTEGGEKHALNVFVNRKKEVKYWAPQTCEYKHDQFQKPELIIF